MQKKTGVNQKENVDNNMLAQMPFYYAHIIYGKPYFKFIEAEEWRKILLNSRDRIIWSYDIRFFSEEGAKELKAEFFDFTGENEVRRSAGLARKTN